MSVLIRGMEMPKNCDTCFVRVIRCKLYLHGRKHRHPDCPLVEVKEPHGRLIDADEMMMSLADWWYSSFGQEETEESKAIRTVMDKIEQSIDAITVIEAEGREE